MLYSVMFHEATGVFDTSRFRGAWSQIIISCFFDPLDPFLCGACPHWAVCKFQSFWRRSVPPKVLCCAYRELLPWNFWHIRFHPVVRLGTWMYKIFLRNYKISRHDDPSQKPFFKVPRFSGKILILMNICLRPSRLNFLFPWRNEWTSPEMTVDKNAGANKQEPRRGKKCFYQSSKKSCPLKAWFFGARKVQSSIIQSDKNHFEESRERGLIWVVYYNPWPCCDVLQEK